MVAGPVDVIIIGFPGNNFNGQVAPAIKDLVANGTIRILDLLFVVTDAEGNLSSLRIQDLDAALDPAMIELDVALPGSLDHHDAEELAEDLPANSSALLVAYENTWAAGFVSAIQGSGGVVIDQIRIPVDAVEQFLAS